MGRAGGNLSEAGSVAWLFESKGIIAINAKDGGGEDIALTAIDAGAEDVDIQDNHVEVVTRAEDLEKVRLARVTTSRWLS